jgi:hypothetical protein
MAKITKVEKLGLAELVEDLRVDSDTGGLRTNAAISKLLKQQGHQVGTAAVKAYLKKLDKQRKPYAEEAIKEAVAPHSISSIDVIDTLIEQGSKKLKATGDGKESLGGWANAVRAQLDLIKTRHALLGVKLASTDKNDDDLLSELEDLRRRASGTGVSSGNGTAGPAGIPSLPN